ncbi:MAG: FAD-dependent oxidoreductase [Oscillospiraceae bacterium]
MGYDYIVFDEHHFNEDLQWVDAVPMFERLQALADSKGLEFGLKLSNTFPVDTTRNELPGTEMYMSGRSLFPLTIEMCNRISRQFNGKMRISFAGGAEFFNCDKLFAAGIWPITVATTILKPGGYNRLHQMVEKTEKLPYKAFCGTDSSAISDMSTASHSDFHHLKPIKPVASRKSEEKVPWIDCFTAPCKGGCPIHQDIPEYIELCRKGLYGPALKLITEKNALPFITGTICAHRCQNKCSRNFYEESVQIRNTKLVAATKGYGALMADIKVPAKVEGKKAAIIGGGPTGIAAAYFLGRAGIETTIFEREEKLGGVPRYVIPAFRISDEAIDKDIALMERYGVEVKCGLPAPSVEELKKLGYTHILIATGAWQAGKLDIPGNVKGVIGWMKEMKTQVKPCLDGHVVVVGAGNTAMDAARVAKRMGAASSTIVYRRTKKEMPADEHELKLAIDEGVNLVELAAPVAQENGKLKLEKMKLGEPDASGRRSPSLPASSSRFRATSSSPRSARRSTPSSWPITGSRWSAKAPPLRPTSRTSGAQATHTAAPRRLSRVSPTRPALQKQSSAKRTPMISRSRLSLEGTGDRQEGHFEDGEGRLLRRLEMPRLQHRLRKLRRFLPEPRKRRHQALRWPPSDPAHRQNVQRVRQLHAVLPVRIRALPRQVHALPDEGRHGRQPQCRCPLPRRRQGARPYGGGQGIRSVPTQRAAERDREPDPHRPLQVRLSL